MLQYFFIWAKLRREEGEKKKRIKKKERQWRKEKRY
jgi:hypothetical protein